MNCDEIQFTSFNYDDGTTVASSCYSTLSVGNALEDIEVYNVTEDIVYSGIPVPKGHKSTRISKETPCTILTADTIGTVCSRRILKVLFDTYLAVFKPRNCLTHKGSRLLQAILKHQRWSN